MLTIYAKELLSPLFFSRIQLVLFEMFNSADIAAAAVVAGGSLGFGLFVIVFNRVWTTHMIAAVT